MWAVTCDALFPMVHYTMGILDQQTFYLGYVEGFGLLVQVERDLDNTKHISHLFIPKPKGS